MKKILVLFVLFLLAGCSEDQLEKIEVDRNHYATIFEWEPIGVSENGVYFIKDEILYYKDDNEDAVPLGSVNYIDGEKTITSINGINSKIRYDSLAGRDLICYGDRIYIEYHSRNHDMSDYYQLASVDLKGEDFKTHIIFDYVPQRIVMNNGKTYVSYLNHETNEEYIEIYDQNFELINTEYYDSSNNTDGFYIENDELIVTDDDSITYESDNIKITNKVETDSDGNMKTLAIVQIDEKEYTFENKAVLFVNENYFYVCSDVMPQTYERYHLNGELDKSIVIGEHIESEGILNNLFEMDFSYILKLRGENIAYGYSGNGEYPRIFEVDFEKETCNYVDE